MGNIKKPFVVNYKISLLYPSTALCVRAQGERRSKKPFVVSASKTSSRTMNVLRLLRTQDERETHPQ